MRTDRTGIQAAAFALPVPSRLALERSGILLMAVAILLVGMARETSVDLWLADRMFDATAGRFDWRNHWFAAEFMHRWARIPLVMMGALVVIAALVDGLRSISPLTYGHRLRLRMTAACALLVPLAVSLMKHYSSVHCPWDVDRYGGLAPYVRLFDALPAAVPAGHCFPAGHATSALWLTGLCVWLLPHRPRSAAGAGVFSMALGLGLGWVQQLRGAHFLSHTLASAWVAAAVLWVIFIVVAATHDRGTCTAYATFAPTTPRRI